MASLATRSMIPIAATLGKLEEVLKKPGHADMPAFVLNKCTDGKAKLAVWKKQCHDVLNKAAKNASKEGFRQDDLGFTIKEVSDFTAELKSAAHKLDQMIVLASPASATSC